MRELQQAASSSEEFGSRVKDKLRADVDRRLAQELASKAKLLSPTLPPFQIMPRPPQTPPLLLLPQIQRQILLALRVLQIKMKTCRQ